MLTPPVSKCVGVFGGGAAEEIWRGACAGTTAQAFFIIKFSRKPFCLVRPLCHSYCAVSVFSRPVSHSSARGDPAAEADPAAAEDPAAAAAADPAAAAADPTDTQKQHQQTREQWQTQRQQQQ